jgi:mRNA interferase RelE/StbE
MDVGYSKKFLKQLASIPNETRVKIEHFVFAELISASSMSSLGKVEKMQGYEGFYKVRFGNYRLGLVIDNNLVTIKTVMHRREIYKFFP